MCSDYQLPFSFTFYYYKNLKSIHKISRHILKIHVVADSCLHPGIEHIILLKCLNVFKLSLCLALWVFFYPIFIMYRSNSQLACLMLRVVL